MSTFIPPTPAANKSAEQHEEPSEQDSFNHLLYKVLRLNSEQVQDLNDWMAHRGIPNVHEVIAQNFRKPHALEDNLKFITQGKTSYIQSNVMISLSLMISYIKHCQYSAKSKNFGPFYYIQIDPQDYDEWRTSPPEEEIHFQTPSKFGSATTPPSTVSSEASESYITLTNFKKGIKRDASAYPIFKNERYYNTFIRHFKATAKAQGLNSLMDPNFTPGSDEHEQQLFQEQQDFLYSVLISSLKTEFSEALVKDHEGDAQLILELLHDHHTGNSQYSRAEINRITKYLTNIKLDDTWRGTNESFLMHYNDQLRLLDSLVDSGEELPDNARVTFLESAIESVPDLQCVKITDNVLQAQLGSTRPISYRSYFDLLKDAAFHPDKAMIQFPPEMDENWVRYGLAKLGQISKLPNWQRMLFCAYTTQLLHSTGEVCWNNNDSYFIWFEFVCRNSGQIASRRSWKRSCLGLEYTSKCSRLALLWEPN